MSATKIEWATHTVNWLAGCSHCSPGCDNCYAETMSRRLATMGQPRYQGVTKGGAWTGKVEYDRLALYRAFDGLRNARKPRRVFVNSMSDTFHPAAPWEAVVDLAKAIKAANGQRWHGDEWRFDLDLHTTRLHSRAHVLMLLTKRPTRLLAWQREHFPGGLPPWVWVGVTVEDQERVDQRVPVLLQVQASVRFVSCEPLLGAVRLDDVAHITGTGQTIIDALAGDYPNLRAFLPGVPRPPRLSWVIVGGESGPHARPMHPEWARSLRDQCQAAEVPFFFKQWGEWAPLEWSCVIDADKSRVSLSDGYPDGHMEWRPYHLFDDGREMARVGKKYVGREIDSETWAEVPR